MNTNAIPVSREIEGTHRRAAFHYIAVVGIIAIYGGQVCPFIESLSPAQLLSMLTLIMLWQYSIRYVSHILYITRFTSQLQAPKLFKLELALFFSSAIFLLIFNALVYNFPIESGIKILLGYAALGLFVAIDLALKHERNIVSTINKEDHHTIDHIDQHYFPLTAKLTLTSSICIVFIMAVVFLVVNKDLEWLVQAENTLSLTDARQAILSELAFIVAVFLSYLLLVIHSYGLNLKLFFHNENNTLINATQGNLEGRVPISSHDEFGIMAKHTNLMIKGLRDLTSELQVTRDATIMSLASLAETRDNETGAHLLRTQRYVRVLAEQLQNHERFHHYLDEKSIDLLFKSAPLHDIGKVGIPDKILLKPDKLSNEEFQIMKTHAALGAQALEVAEKQLTSNFFLKAAKEIAYSHHEKWDGSGYPLGLKGDDIPIAGRLMALADVYDALISKRVYKPAFSHEKAVSIIREGKGSHFDPDIVDAFDQVEQMFVEIAREFSDSEQPETVN